jgi:hypothetical protein
MAVYNKSILQEILFIIIYFTSKIMYIQKHYELKRA